MREADYKLDGGNAIVEGKWLLVKCWDIKLDSPDRRSRPGGHRRALVHGLNDELVLNWNKDYPGGTVVQGDLEIQKDGTFQLINSKKEVIISANNNGDLRLGGHGEDGDILLIASDGQKGIWIDAKRKSIKFLDRSLQDTVVQISADDFTESPWPKWKDESASPSKLDLIREIRRMKDEINKLQSRVDDLEAGR